MKRIDAGGVKTASVVGVSGQGGHNLDMFCVASCGNGPPPQQLMSEPQAGSDLHSCWRLWRE